ncbi:MAG: PKD domain-containing protein [Pseudomonadota bacterium]
MAVSLSVTRRSAFGFAPEAVFLRAGVTHPDHPEADTQAAYDPSFHGLRYAWEFGDPGAVSDKVVNLPAAHNDLNVGYGKEVAHVYARPGRYAVACVVHDEDGTEIGRAEMDVVVGDPEPFYGGPRTILVDPEGRGDPATYPDAAVVTGLQGALETMRASPAPVRILLKRGTVTPWASRIGIDRNVAGVRFGAWGSGPRPVLAADPRMEGRVLISVDPNHSGDTVFDGLAFEGPWDATTETGRQITLIEAFQTRDRAYLMTDCTFRGSGIAVHFVDLLPEDRTRAALTLNNCDITGWGDYGVYAGRFTVDQHIAVIGCAIHQHPEAMMGGGGTRDGQRNQHGPLRLSGGGHAYIACSDLFSRNGWSEAGQGLGADQPCLRWNSNTAALRSAGVVDRVAMEGGFTLVSVANVLGEEPVRGTNIVFDKCLLVGSARTRVIFDIEYTGVTVRNCLIVRPETPMVSLDWIAVFEDFRRDDRVYLDPGWPVRLYSNTIVNRMGPGRPLTVANGIDDFAVFSDENNVLFTPNAPGEMREAPGLAEAPLETVGGVWTARYLGVRHLDRGGGAQIEMDRRFATPAGAVRLYAPAPGSPLIGTAMGTVAADDFFGQLRGDPPDRGAIEA